MIEKMKFLSLTGPKADIDRIAGTYLSRYEIHLENALTELKDVDHLAPYIQMNPYKELLNKANDFSKLLENKNIEVKSMDLAESTRLITELDKEVTLLTQKKNDLEEERTRLQESMRVIQPFRELHYNLSSVLDFRFIHYRFGRIRKIRGLCL